MDIEGEYGSVIIFEGNTSLGNLPYLGLSPCLGMLINPIWKLIGSLEWLRKVFDKMHVTNTSAREIFKFISTARIEPGLGLWLLNLLLEFQFTFNIVILTDVRVLLLGRIVWVAYVQCGCCLRLGRSIIHYLVYGVYTGHGIYTFGSKTTSGYVLKKRLHQFVENRPVLGQPKMKVKHTIVNQSEPVSKKITNSNHCLQAKKHVTWQGNTSLSKGNLCWNN